MTVNRCPFLTGERPRLVEDRVGNAQLPDVVEQGGTANDVHATRRKSHGVADENRHLGCGDRMAMSERAFSIDNVREAAADQVDVAAGKCSGTTEVERKHGGLQRLGIAVGQALLP